MQPPLNQSIQQPATYRSRSRAVGLGVFLVLILGLGAIAAARASAVGAALAAAILLATAIPVARAAAAGLFVRGDQLVIRGPLRTESVATSEVENFSLGRYKVLGSVCLLHRKGGAGVLPVFAIQGITGQPNRRASVEASKTVAELNERFATIRP